MIANETNPIVTAGFPKPTVRTKGKKSLVGTVAAVLLIVATFSVVECHGQNLEAKLRGRKLEPSWDDEILPPSPTTTTRAEWREAPKDACLAAASQHVGVGRDTCFGERFGHATKKQCAIDSENLLNDIDNKLCKFFRNLALPRSREDCENRVRDIDRFDIKGGNDAYCWIFDAPMSRKLFFERCPIPTGGSRHMRTIFNWFERDFVCRGDNNVSQRINPADASAADFMNLDCRDGSEPIPVPYVCSDGQPPRQLHEVPPNDPYFGWQCPDGVKKQRASRVCSDGSLPPSYYVRKCKAPTLLDVEEIEGWICPNLGRIWQNGDSAFPNGYCDSPYEGLRYPIFVGPDVTQICSDGTSPPCEVPDIIHLSGDSRYVCSDGNEPAKHDDEEAFPNGKCSDGTLPLFRRPVCSGGSYPFSDVADPRPQCPDGNAAELSRMLCPDGSDPE